MEDNIRKEDRLRAAAYCRVSTELEEQEGSFEWQMRHYTELLSGNLDVELVQVYGDEGYSGRYADRRPEFMRMLRDCENGKIDIIYTKSISRFSRNLADCATTIRRLKELGIAVIFEKEGINSMDNQSELLFHILTIIAQEESKSIGMNVKWSIDKRHAEGKPTGKVTYGYRRADSDGQWRIEEEEARRVRYAFEQAAQCASYQSIREGLDEMEKQAGTGISWTRNRNRVPLLLRDVSYTGDYITDRYYTALSENGHRYSRHNRGERDQYYLENHHEGIVSKRLFDRVQMLIRLNLLNSRGYRLTEERCRVLENPDWKKKDSDSTRGGRIDESYCREDMESKSGNCEPEPWYTQSGAGSCLCPGQYGSGDPAVQPRGTDDGISGEDCGASQLDACGRLCGRGHQRHQREKAKGVSADDGGL